MGAAFGGNLTWVEEGLQQQYDAGLWTDNGEYQDFSGCGGKCNPMPYDHFPRMYINLLLKLGYS
jgi:hypothetical protein